MTILDAFQRLAATPEAMAASIRQAGERELAKAEVLARYGDAASVMTPGPDERALIEACRPFIEAGRLDPHFVPAPETMDADVAVTVREATPFPTTVRGLLDEYMRWDRTVRDRTALDQDWMQPVAMGCRERILEDALDTVPSTSFADIEARLAWMQVVLDFGFSRDVRSDEACLDTLRADVARLASRSIPLP